ncbi:3-phosphoshikimate 1-carboxyvinyltransferase [Clostridium hydrogenum]|uniref:3-phosphoshikimate 1-carboxyvinyltransferase n=1 Tax=Clostridium hydrogenum TaxID=2855764 RepID=UPI001F43DA3C|nr:3-phosphoshikimate 1-carboxyvinyltransferase [Clostridium hydrogenum]
MKCVKINPKKLEGSIKIPSSKSLCHRAIICAALSEGESTIENINYSKDIEATLKCMENLGAAASAFNNNETIKLKKGTVAKGEKSLDCFESGSTLRFLIPVALLCGEKVIFSGRGKLPKRPLDPYFNIFDEQNIKYSHPKDEFLPLVACGDLKAGNFELKGNISSQFISGLMFALPLLKGDSTIKITTPLESIGYVDMTLDMLNKFGINIENNNYELFKIKGNQKYKAQDCRVEGDFSQAAFWMVAGILNGDIKCLDLNHKSLQGDKAVVGFIEKMGGNIDTENFIVKTSKTKGTVIDGSQCPDIIPVLTVLAALSEGTTEIINAERLRIKESDRLKAMTTELNKIGADIIEKEAGLIIHGKESLNGGTVQSWNDHRIAMALAVAALKCKEPLIIEGSECVSKSYPHFFEDFKKLGGDVDEWCMGE